MGESQENYLESILMVEQELGSVRSIDIANLLEVSRPSVSVAMKKLTQENFITIDNDNLIHLTEEGRKIAECILERHRFFADWLIELGVSEKVARRDACRIEHAISDESFQAFKDRALKDLEEERR